MRKISLATSEKREWKSGFTLSTFCFGSSFFVVNFCLMIEGRIFKNLCMFQVSILPDIKFMFLKIRSRFPSTVELAKEGFLPLCGRSK